MVGGKLEPNQQKPCSNQPSSRADNGLVELVWENGQIVMQDQSSKVDKNHSIQSTPSFVPRNGDPGSLHAKIGKFSEVESMLDDISPIVPSGDLVLNQEDDMIRWLSYPLDDPLPQDYCSDLIPEISGVTANAISTQDTVLSVDKRMNCYKTNGNLHDGGSTLKAAPSSYSKPHIRCSWRPQQSQTSDALGSGVTDVITSNNSSNPQSVLFGDSSQGKSVIGDCTSRQSIQKLPTNNANFINFSHFSKPVFRAKSSGLNSDIVPKVAPSVCVGKIGVPEKNSLSNAIVNSGKPVVKENKDISQMERRDNPCKESCLRNEKPAVTLSEAANSRKEVRDEKIAEPVVVTSSVGSGNSADRVSYGQTQNSKRKFIDVDDSECRSDDVETESAGVRKPTNGRGGNGSKRSRAAEVHNLSERRRRDRINEKMRALQELIPNCNKADKASMLDEAIEYLKTLQLQVQIMSMGAGLCMPPMMYHYPAPHFPPLMGMGMGYGINMHGGVSHMFPVTSVQRPHFPPLMPGVPSNFPRIPLPCSDIPPGYGNNPAGQVIPSVILPRPPPPPPALAPLNGGGPHNVFTSHMNLSTKDCGTNKNSLLMRDSEPGGSMNHIPNQMPQVTNEDLSEPATVRENEQTADRVCLANIKLASSSTKPSKEAGCS